MLVLTRKRMETIQIGNDIVLKVIQTAKSTVKIGIEAPVSVRVMRGELNAESTPVTLVDLLKSRQNDSSVAAAVHNS